MKKFLILSIFFMGTIISAESKSQDSINNFFSTKSAKQQQTEQKELESTVSEQREELKELKKQTALMLHLLQRQEAREEERAQREKQTTEQNMAQQRAAQAQADAWNKKHIVTKIAITLGSIYLQTVGGAIGNILLQKLLIFGVEKTLDGLDHMTDKAALKLSPETKKRFAKAFGENFRFSDLMCSSEQEKALKQFFKKHPTLKPSYEDMYAEYQEQLKAFKTKQALRKEKQQQLEQASDGELTAEQLPAFIAFINQQEENKELIEKWGELKWKFRESGSYQIPKENDLR